MNEQQIDQLRALIDCAIASHHRCMVVCSGDDVWCRSVASTFLSTFYSEAPGNVGDCEAVAGLAAVGWLGENPLPGVRQLQRSHHSELLGADRHCVVVDAWQGLDVDALAQLVGTLTGGGCLLLLVPALADWPHFSDPHYRRIFSSQESLLPESAFLLRWVRRLRASQPGVALLQQHAGLSLQQRDRASIARATRPAHDCRQPLQPPAAQRQVIDAVVGLCARDAGTVLLTAQRGRGKSVALGLAACQLCVDAQQHILVTAPRKANIASLFDAYERSALALAGGDLRFCPVDKLVLSHPACDLLIIDEAAALPVPVLKQLLAHYPRILLATTLHGYEGSGHGFRLRFLPVLEAQPGGCQTLFLHEPIRWAADDPVERHFGELLLLADGLLDTEPPLDFSTGESAAPILSQTICVRAVTQAQLLADENLVSAVYALLQAAHYLTRPSDLRFLLDAPTAQLWIAEVVGSDKSPALAGVLLAGREGGLPDDLAGHVADGSRRPRGNLLAQRIAHVSGDARWCMWRSLRVMRIAVAPALRRLGVGAALVEAMERSATASGIHFWGSSFAARRDVLDFWRAQHAQLVHLGLRLDTASGDRSAMVMRILDSGLAAPAAQLLAQFRRDLPLWCARMMPELDSMTLQSLRAAAAPTVLACSGSGAVDADCHALPDAQRLADRQTLLRFVDGEVSFELAYPALQRWSQSRELPLQHSAIAPCGDHETLRLAAALDWSQLQAHLNEVGRKSTMAAIKAALIRQLN